MDEGSLACLTVFYSFLLCVLSVHSSVHIDFNTQSVAMSRPATFEAAAASHIVMMNTQCGQLLGYLLQRFFHTSQAIFVATGLDLIDNSGHVNLLE